MKLLKVGVLVVIFLILLCLPVLGFTLPGTKALGMGGAFTAVADDASSVFWNPAGLSQSGRFDLDLSITAGGKNIESLSNLYGLYEALENDDFDEAKNLTQKITPPIGLRPTFDVEILLLRHLAFSVLGQMEFNIEEFKYDEDASYVETKDKETALAFGYLTLAGKASESFFLGINLKYIKGVRHHSHFRLTDAGSEVITPEETSESKAVFSFDLGLLHKTKRSKISWGLMVQDILEPKINFPDISEESFRSLSLDRKVNLGISFKAFPRLILAADLHNVLSAERTLHLGGELDLSLVKLRVGLDNGNLAYGVGLKLLLLHLEAAYSERGRGNPVVSLLLRLG